MQNNGQALADLQKTPKPVSQNRNSKTVRGAKKLNDLPIGKLCGKK